MNDKHKSILERFVPGIGVILFIAFIVHMIQHHPDELLFEWIIIVWILGIAIHGSRFIPDPSKEKDDESVFIYNLHEERDNNC